MVRRGGTARRGAARRGAVRRGVARCDAVRCDVVRRGVVRCCAVRYGAIRCGAVWCDVVRCCGDVAAGLPARTAFSFRASTIDNARSNAMVGVPGRVFTDGSGTAVLPHSFPGKTPSVLRVAMAMD